MPPSAEFGERRGEAGRVVVYQPIASIGILTRLKISIHSIVPRMRMSKLEQLPGDCRSLFICILPLRDSSKSSVSTRCGLEPL